MNMGERRSLLIYAAILAMLSASTLIFYSLDAETSALLIRENGPVEFATAATYIISFLFLSIAPSMRLGTRMSLAFIFLVFFAKEIDLTALLGMPHIKFSVFRDPNISLSYKAVVLVLAGSLVASVVYLLIRHSASVVRGSLKGERVAVGVLLGVVMLCVSQGLDSLNGVTQRAGISLARSEFYGTIVEELLELGVAIVFLMAILFYILDVGRARNLRAGTADDR